MLQKIETKEIVYVGDGNHPGYYFVVNKSEAEQVIEEMRDEGLCPFIAISFEDYFHPSVSVWKAETEKQLQ